MRLLITCIFLNISSLVAAANLPDFTRLIAQSSPAVIKISTATHKEQNTPFQRDQIPEIFRYLLDPQKSPERELQSTGSGFFISSDGYLITNNHVIEGADEIIVQMTDRREYEAVLVGTDSRSDLALLKVEEEGLPFLQFANSENLKVGEWVLAIGSPFDLEFSASVGIVSAMGRSIVNRDGEDYVPFIQTDAAINPGNSGGPLFNLSGKVVGVNSQIYTQTGGSIGVSFAIPASVALNVVDQLKKKGRVDRGWLGVAIQDLDRQLADAFGLKKPGGALIAEVIPGGPADEAGLEASDVIIRFNNKPIELSGDLPHIVGATAPGKEVQLTVLRKRRKHSVKVVVGTLSRKEVASAALEDFTLNTNKQDRLGLDVGSLENATRIRQQVDSGVEVLAVAAGTAAAEAEIKVGDVITHLGFEKITGVENYQSIVASLPINTPLPLRFYRDHLASYRAIEIRE